MRQIRNRLFWLLLAGGLYFVSKGGYAVYPLILSSVVDLAALSESSDATNPAGGVVPPLRDGFSVVSPEVLKNETPSLAEQSEVPTDEPYSSDVLTEGAFLARLEIPRLRATIRVVEGVSDKALRLGAGHLRGTPLPGDGSNSVIAGHRDTYFRVLNSIQIGDRVFIERGTRQFAYTVFETRVVDPDNVSVLNPVDGRILTLITCYPFHFLGSAPQRFIVKASADNVPFEKSKPGNDPRSSDAFSHATPATARGT